MPVWLPVALAVAALCLGIIVIPSLLMLVLLICKLQVLITELEEYLDWLEEGLMEA